MQSSSTSSRLRSGIVSITSTGIRQHPRGPHIICVRLSVGVLVLLGCSAPPCACGRVIMAVAIPECFPTTHCIPRNMVIRGIEMIVVSKNTLSLRGGRFFCRPSESLVRPNGKARLIEMLLVGDVTLGPTMGPGPPCATPRRGRRRRREKTPEIGKLYRWKDL
jgi:hypothetical protein